MMTRNAGAITFGKTLRTVEVAGFILTETEHPPGLVLPRHAHAFANVTFVLRGSLHETCARYAEDFGPSSVMVKPPAESHANRYGESGARCLVLEITPRRLEASRPLATLLDRPAFHEKGGLTARFLEIYGELQQRDGAAPLVLEGLILPPCNRWQRRELKETGGGRCSSDACFSDRPATRGTTPMCFDCEHEDFTRRSFLVASTATLTGIALPGRVAAELPPEGKALEDPTIRHEMVRFRSGTATIKAFLARPKDTERHRAIVVLHGNPGIPEWVQSFTAGLAQAGYAGLVFDLNSRAVPDSMKLDKSLEFYISNTFDKQVTQDWLAALAYLKAQPFTKPGGVGWVGFCGGGRKGLVLAAQCEDIRAVVSFYGAMRFTRRNAKDPMSDVMDVVEGIKVPVQGHYGLLDKVAPVADAKVFEQKLKEGGIPVEMYYYPGAGHGFYDSSWRPEQEGAFGYNADAAKRAHERMVKFLKIHAG